MFAAIRRASSLVSRPIGHAPAGLVLVVDMGKCLALGVADAESFGRGVVDLPWGVNARVMSSAAALVLPPLQPPWIAAA
jgi:hypothetical protein